MFKTLRSHFYQNLILRYIDFRDVMEKSPVGNGNSMREGISTAIALYHFNEHLATVQTYSEKAIVSLCPDYELVRDITNASKHCILTRGTPKISKADSFSDFIMVTQYVDDLGAYSDSRNHLLVELDSGTKRDIFEICTTVINFWGELLLKDGILGEFKPFLLPERPGSRYLPRAEARPLNFVATTGQSAFGHTMQIQFFDREKGCIVSPPSPLKRVTMKIYKPIPYTVCLTYKDGTVEEVKGEMDHAQKAFFDALPDSEKEKFAVMLARGQVILPSSPTLKVLDPPNNT